MRTCLLILLVMALLLRLLFSVLVVGWSAPLRGDEIDYHSIAVNLSEGKGFTLSGGLQTARRPPVYPLLLGAMYKLFGTSVVVGRVLQLILGTFVVYLVFLVAKQYFSERAAFIATLLAACNPFLIFISGYLLTENIYMILMLASLLILPLGRALWMKSKHMAIGAFILALLTLTRPTGFLMSLWFFSALAFVTHGSIRVRISHMCLFIAVWLIPFVPWTLRNHVIFGEPVFFTTHGGITFYQGNNASVRDIPRYHGGVAPLYALPDYEKFKGLGEVGTNREAWRMGKAFIKENRRDVPLMTARKFLRFWRLNSDMGLSGIKSGWWWNKDSYWGKLASSLDVGFVYAVIVFPLFLIGLVGSTRAFRSLYLLYGIIIVHMVVALVFYGSLRGRIPVEPVIAIFASEGLLRIIRMFRSLQSQEV